MYKYYMNDSQIKELDEIKHRLVKYFEVKRLFTDREWNLLQKLYELKKKEKAVNTSIDDSDFQDIINQFLDFTDDSSTFKHSSNFSSKERIGLFGI